MFDGLRVQHRSPEPSFDPRTTNQAGEDGPPHDEPARARLRAEAVAWLRADLAALARRLDADGAAAAPEVAARSPTGPATPTSPASATRASSHGSRRPSGPRPARSCPTRTPSAREPSPRPAGSRDPSEVASRRAGEFVLPRELPRQDV